MASIFPRSYEVKILLNDEPHYKGSIHDDEVARARGYKAALIPGAFIYGHISRGAIESWGQDWAERGSMSARFRRPVYNHDVITVLLDELVDDGQGVRSQARVVNGDGEEVATGWIGLAHQAPVPPAPATLTLLPTPAVPPPVKAGEVPVGGLNNSTERVRTARVVSASLG